MDCKSISPVGVTLGNFIGLLFLHLMTQVGCAIPRFASLFTRRNFSLTSYDLWILYRCTPTPRRLRSVTSALLKDYFPFPFLLSLARSPSLRPVPLDRLLVLSPSANLFTDHYKLSYGLSLVQLYLHIYNMYVPGLVGPITLSLSPPLPISITHLYKSRSLAGAAVLSWFLVHLLKIFLAHV